MWTQQEKGRVAWADRLPLTRTVPCGKKRASRKLLQTQGAGALWPSRGVGCGLGGRLKREALCIHMADSLCSTAEIKTTFKLIILQWKLAWAFGNIKNHTFNKDEYILHNKKMTGSRTLFPDYILSADAFRSLQVEYHHAQKNSLSKMFLIFKSSI